MTALPQPKHSLAATIYRWWEARADDGHRPHLGGSQIGHHCARYLWLTFRWAGMPTFDGRMYRLFDRGQREEAVIVAELRGIGAEVSECQPNGQQWGVSQFGGHLGGSLDGVVRNLPGGSPSNWELLEFKTHNAKSFKELADKGVEKAKHQHWCQMQIYMHLTGMTRANYLAVCKDDDQIYHERVHHDAEAGQRLLDRAESVIFGPEPLPRCSTDPSWYQCKMCGFHSLCHGDTAPEVNCRTCAHSTPLRDGSWTCERHNIELTLGAQKTACQAHRFIPQLLDHWAELIDADQVDNWVRYRLLDGRGEFTNGQPPAGHESAEIHAAADKGILADRGFVQALRQGFDGRVVG